MSAIQAQIDELQKQLVMQQMAEAEREQKKRIVEGSIQQLEEFCNISDTILDRPPPSVATRAAAIHEEKKRREMQYYARGEGCQVPIEKFLPPSSGKTLKEVFKNRLDPKHPVYRKIIASNVLPVLKTKEQMHLKQNVRHNTLEQSGDEMSILLERVRSRDGWGDDVRFGRRLPTSGAEKEIKVGEWERELEEKVYSTTCASDMYINESLKCILAIVKKQQQEIDWLKSKLD